MTEPGDNIIGVRTVYDAVIRLEGKLDGLEGRVNSRSEATDSRIDGVMLKQERLEGRLEGSLGMIKWLGPTGVAAVLFAIAKAAGFI